MSTSAVRRLTGAFGVTAIGVAGLSGVAVATPTHPVQDSHTTPFNPVIAGARRALTDQEIQAANVTETPDGQAALASADLARFTPQDTSQTALNRVASGLQVFRFGSGRYVTQLVIDGSADFVVFEGVNQVGETVWEVAVLGGSTSDDAVNVTGGRSVQAIPGNDKFEKYFERHWNEQVGDLFDRHMDDYFYKASKDGRVYFRGFFTASGGPIEGTSREMKSMWVEMDRNNEGWPADRQESHAPEPRESQVGGEEHCTTWGWGAGVTVELPPIGFSLEQQMSNQLCLGDEQFDPVNRAEIASHGSKWNYQGDRQLSRSVATALIVDIADVPGWSQSGWFMLSGQSDENT